MRSSCRRFANVSQFHGLLKGALGEVAGGGARRRRSLRRRGLRRRTARRRATRRQAPRAHRPAHRRAHRPAAVARRGEEPAHRRPQLLHGGAASRRAASSAGSRRERPAPMAASRGREMEFDPGIEAIAPPYTMAAMAYFGEQLGMSTEHALRGALARHAQGVELEPRRGQGQQLRHHQPRPRARAAPQRAPEGLRRQRPLRPRHAVQRERLVAGPARRAGRRAGARAAPLLRRRPHDVHAPGRPDAAEVAISRPGSRPDDARAPRGATSRARGAAAGRPPVPRAAARARRAATRRRASRRARPAGARRARCRCRWPWLRKISGARTATIAASGATCSARCSDAGQARRALARRGRSRATITRHARPCRGSSRAV